MAGFSPVPPGVEICGTYKIIYVSALGYNVSQRRANIFLRRQPKSGRLIIKESSIPIGIGVNGRRGMTRPNNMAEPFSVVTSPTIFDGEVFLTNEGRKVDRFFGPGYKFYGFGANSRAMLSYSSMASNASLIVTKQNDNKGRIYRVDAPKAFKLVNDETGVVADESTSFETQEHEVDVARRICKSQHYSFLCRELGLPCSASALITQFATNRQPYIFAEPGDIWIDIRLSTPNRTYVLARRE